ncbi:Aste57867_21051 [Aphanomyces stellatus]|uniref:Aste57867_21051 protein n=1 Tax=Aphanomyces stellatus TaxID=120398 RepID=A0A485LHS2_9STRA|nr:hypothetical protein As57867_020983 [Aphanomyces stellatus]VFT97726.1 Aste57867_21051 [Aphanomyces stellatus]
MDNLYFDMDASSPHEFAFHDKLDLDTAGSTHWHTLDDMKELIIDVNLDTIFLPSSHLTSSPTSSNGCRGVASPTVASLDAYLCSTTAAAPTVTASVVASPSSSMAAAAGCLPSSSSSACKQKCQYANCRHPAKVVQEYGYFCNRHAVNFPCGFPRCREKAVDKSSMCRKHADQVHAMGTELSTRSQTTRMCRTEGCFKVRQGRGHCTAHEKLLIATGQMASKKRDVDIAFTMCCFPQCTKHAQRNRFCCKHGKELSVQAQAVYDRGATSQTYEEILAIMQKNLRRCQFGGCEKNARYNQLCTTHYHLKTTQSSQMIKTNDPSSALPHATATVAFMR